MNFIACLKLARVGYDNANYVPHHLHHGICAPSKPSFEQLDANDGKHEEEKQSDHQDVPDVLHGGDHALHHMLQAGRSVDRSAKTDETHPKTSLTSTASELV